MKPSKINLAQTEGSQRGSARPLRRHYLLAKKLIFLLLGVGLSAGVMAQTDIQKQKETQKTEVQKKRTDMKNLRSDVRDHKAATHQVNHDLSHARIKKAMHDHKAVAEANKRENKDAKRLKAHGVDHSVVKAKRQVKVQDDKRKDHM